MKLKMKSKALAILMSMAMAFTMMPMMAQTAYADDLAPSPSAINLGTDVLGAGSNTQYAVKVWMADLCWRVIGYAGSGVASSEDTMTLISNVTIKTIQFRADRQAADANHYGASNLKTEIEAVANTFSDGEKVGIIARNLASGGYETTGTDYIAGNPVTGALLWPLSTKEAIAMDKNLRILNPDWPGYTIFRWWLRSPGDVDISAATVSGYGSIDSTGTWGDYRHGFRPAYHFNLKSVIFTSAAAGGKPAAVAPDSLQNPESVSGDTEWKLTIKDEAHKAFKVNSVTRNEDTLTINYSGAVKGSNEYISAIIKSSDGKLKQYGKLAPASDADGAEVTVNIKGKMTEGDTIYILNEQCNGDNKTDFASMPQEVVYPHADDEHVLEFVDFTWTGNENDGYTGAVANFKCKSDDGYTKTVKAQMRDDDITTPSTCMTDGKTSFVAYLDAADSPDGSAHEETREANLPKASGAGGSRDQHDWEFVGFTWKDLETSQPSAVANYVCKRDRSHTCDEEANISFSEEVPMTCTTEGKGTYTATIDAMSPDNMKHTDSKQVILKANHTVSFWIRLDDNHHRGRCRRCGETVTLDHRWNNGRVLQPATCTENGIMLSTCDDCQAMGRQVINAGHDYGEWTSISDTLHQRVCSLDAAPCRKGESHVGCRQGERTGHLR